MAKNTDHSRERGDNSSNPAEARWLLPRDAALTDIHRELRATQQLKSTSADILNTALQVSGVPEHPEENTHTSECHACEVFGVHAEFVINNVGDIVALPIGPGKPCPWG